MATRTALLTASLLAFSTLAQAGVASPQSDEHCKPIDIPSAFVGRGGMDRDKSHATLAYVTAVLQQALKRGDCMPCPAERYAWADFVHQEIGVDQDPAQLAPAMYHMLAGHYSAEGLSVAQADYKASCPTVG